jgi:hypothetical protein
LTQTKVQWKRKRKITAIVGVEWWSMMSLTSQIPTTEMVGTNKNLVS